MRGRRRPNVDHRELVYAALCDAGEPSSAYEIILRLRDRVALAPATVYRTLGRLIGAGNRADVRQRSRRQVAESEGASLPYQPAERPSAVFLVCVSRGRKTESAQDPAIT